MVFTVQCCCWCLQFSVVVGVYSSVLLLVFTVQCCSQPTQACADCSKKVPTSDIALHKEMLCSAHHSLSLPKEEVS